MISESHAAKELARDLEGVCPMCVRSEEDHCSRKITVHVCLVV
jgi:hypothetical protein